MITVVDHVRDNVQWGRASLLVVIGICAVKSLLHVSLVNEYGYHGDELYFIECGRRLAFGYVDHPPLIPWIARVADELGGGLVTLRLPAIAAGVGTLAFAGLLVREWGGGARAQWLALLSLLVAPAHLRLGGMLNIPVIEICATRCSRNKVVVAEQQQATVLVGNYSQASALRSHHRTSCWQPIVKDARACSIGRRR